MIQKSVSVTANQSAEFVLPFENIRMSDVPSVGGKGANLGELAAAGFPVPAGFCITTTAFDCFMATLSDAEKWYTLLDSLKLEDPERVRQVAGQVRSVLRQTSIPVEVSEAIRQAWQAQGSQYAYAVRSSATAEDLPNASFAGQQDTYLGIRGEVALLRAVRDCWASLFTERALLYRLRNGFDSRIVRIAVVVQQMVESIASGILFTADPLNGNRTVLTIDAGFGLGEALVSGMVTADQYRVDKRERKLIERRIAAKRMMIRSLPAGGVGQVDLPPGEQERPVLTDAQALELAALGTRIEAHFGTPQDVEWALYDEHYAILQSRPITTLYPLPEPAPCDGALHAYFSFGHFQVMTDPMPDLVISLWRVIVSAGRPAHTLENPYLSVAGGRIYIDLSPLLRHRRFGHLVPNALSSIDALAAQALETISGREAFRSHGQVIGTRALLGWAAPLFGRAALKIMRDTPGGAPAWGLRLMDVYIARAAHRLASADSTQARVDTAIATLLDLLPYIFRHWFPFFIAGQIADGMLHRVVRGVANPDDLATMARGLEGNVVTDMNLAVSDLADLARQSPPLAEYLGRQELPVQERLEGAAQLPGGPDFLSAWRQFLVRYGTRAPAEMDLSRPRWHEDPTSLLQMVISSPSGSGQAQATHRTEQMRRVAEGEAAASRVVQAAQCGLLGWLRGPVVRRLVRATRQLLATREHHKFWLTRLLGLIKPVLLEAGDSLASAGQIERRDDVWFLTVPELLAALKHTDQAWRERITARRAALARFRGLTPPHVMTSDGEIPTVSPAAGGAPPGALSGTPASAGTVEGVARVVLDPQTATLSHGEILVAPFTDPGWTPLFINAAGLVTEVGGLMTHGSVVAREYGIPAVVGVMDATQRIHTGQRIRVHGTEGYVVVLEER